MSTTFGSIRRALAAAALAATLAAGGAAAQQDDADAAGAERSALEAETARLREQAERMRAQAAELAREQALHAEQRTELDEARAELEAAAREVARLAARSRAPSAYSLWLGADAQRATLGVVVENDAGRARVVSVTPKGPAAEAGIVSGDLIAAVDGTRLDAVDDSTPTQALVERAGQLAPGTPVRLAVVRGDDEREVVVTAGNEKSPFVRILSAHGSGDHIVTSPESIVSVMRPFELLRTFDAWQSMELVALTPELGRYFGTDEGLLVVRAPEREDLSLRDGDVILEIGARVPASPEHASRILATFEPGETLRLTIMRDGRREVLEVVVPERERG